MATQSEFLKSPVKVLNRSAFNKSHQNLLTMKVGTLTPVLVDELIPDSTIDLRAAAIAKLPPLASDTFMRVKMHLEAFFVPFRVLYGGYPAAMSGLEVPNPVASGGTSRVDLPFISASVDGTLGDVDKISAFEKFFGPGTLADYLGYKTARGNLYPDTRVPLDINAFPFLAYHRIYDDWYRNQLVSKGIFHPANLSYPVNKLNSFPYLFNGTGNSSDNVGGDKFPITCIMTKSGNDYVVDDSYSMPKITLT